MSFNKKNHKTPSRKGSAVRRRLTTLLIILVMIAGVGIMLYPSVSNWYNSLHQSRAIQTYQEMVSNGDEKEYRKMLKAAHQYNRKLAESGMLYHMTESQKKEYESLLNLDGTGIMGYVVIPKINVELPVYHGTDDAVLQTSIGHLEGTSLPVGGKSTHTVLTGHRGLPSARLFSDLDQLTEGDTFTVTVLNKTCTYQVDQIRIVLPQDLSNLQIEEGKDYCTLVTCTPYGINTHRLLVRGHRIPNANGNASVIAEAIRIRPVYIVPFIAIPAAILAVLVLWLKMRREKKRERLKLLFCH